MRKIFRPITLACLSVMLTALSVCAQAPASETEKAMFLINRLGFGPTGDDVQRVAQMGTERYIEQQLYPETIPLPSHLQAELHDFPSLSATPAQLFLRFHEIQQQKKDLQEGEDKKQLNQQQNAPLREARDAKLLQAIESPRQLQEALVDFWYNHFNVYAHKEVDTIFVGAYEDQAIRPFVFGHFRDMLEATAKHPAMLYYLDNWKNVVPAVKTNKQGVQQDVGINENYAREVMELHTLGVNGGYSQQDVTQLARILTGWGFGAPPEEKLRQKRGGLARLFTVGQTLDKDEREAQKRGGFYFDPTHHDEGDKIFMGYVFHGQGQNEGEQALDMLARNPATATHISYELAQYFVADVPPDALVKRMAATWQQTGGDLREVMKTLLHSPEFWDSKYRGAKYRTPFHYVVASVRAAGVPVDPEVLSGVLTKMGMEPYGCLTPDGYKNTEDAWLNAGATEQRLAFATALGSGSLQLAHVTHEANGALNKTTDSGKSEPLDPTRLAMVLGDNFSQQSRAAVGAADPKLQAALLLGSPEMMRR